ncbi:MAG TPA: hypothetical protein VM432_12700 [Bdellovibrionales bacterium]|nr:hypothetical protein [Bdellovibrionales bacterium]
MQTPSESENYQQAMQDIVAIRRSIQSYKKTKDGQIGESRFQANQKIHLMTFALCSLFAVIELFTGFGITRALIQESTASIPRALILLSIGVFLALCIATMYFVVNRAAESTQDDFQNYIKRNFVYLQNLSHLSDLSIKFVVVAALLFVNKPEWIAPFLFLFTADYLLQGRFFVLSIRSSMLCAIACAVAAAIMFYANNGQVLWPLIGFDILTAVSIRRLSTMKRVEG